MEAYIIDHFTPSTSHTFSQISIGSVCAVLGVIRRAHATKAAQLQLATASEIDLEIERRPHSSLGGAASGIVVHSSSEVTSGGESTGCCGLGPALIRVKVSLQLKSKKKRDILRLYLRCV